MKLPVDGCPCVGARLGRGVVNYHVWPEFCDSLPPPRQEPNGRTQPHLAEEKPFGGPIILRLG
jgi:hypothetical protein